METKKRALGRGLEQLFNNENLDLNSFEKTVYETATTEEIIDVDLDEITYEITDVVTELDLQDTRKQDYSQLYEVGDKLSSLSANDTTAGSVTTIEHSIEPDEFGDIPF